MRSSECGGRLGAAVHGRTALAWQMSFVAAVLLSALSVIGCGRLTALEPDENGATLSPELAEAPPAINATPAQTAPSQEFEHDAGVVVAGTTLSHSFVFENPLSESLVIARDGDISKNCGCTNLAVTDQKLARASRTNVALSVETSGQNGKVLKGGTISWTAEHGSPYITQFTIKAEVVPAFDLDPAVLSFGAGDVDSGLVRQVHVSSSLPIDWSTLSATSTSAAFEVVDCNGNGGDDASCRVKCSGANGRTTEQAFVRISGNVNDGVGSSKRVSTVLPVLFRNLAAVDVRPLLAIVRISDDGVGTTRLLVSGRELSSHPVTAVTTDGFDIGWKWAAAHREAGFLTVRFNPVAANHATRGELTIAFGTGARVVVPYLIEETQ